MGNGKGAVEGWVAVVKPGRILFEIDGIPEIMARNVCGWRPPSCRSGPGLSVADFKGRHAGDA